MLLEPLEAIVLLTGSGNSSTSDTLLEDIDLHFFIETFNDKNFIADHNYHIRLIFITKGLNIGSFLYLAYPLLLDLFTSFRTPDHLLPPPLYFDHYFLYTSVGLINVITSSILNAIYITKTTNLIETTLFNKLHQHNPSIPINKLTNLTSSFIDQHLAFLSHILSSNKKTENSLFDKLVGAATFFFFAHHYININQNNIEPILV